MDVSIFLNAKENKTSENQTNAMLTDFFYYCGDAEMVTHVRGHSLSPSMQLGLHWNYESSPAYLHVFCSIGYVLRVIKGQLVSPT